MRRVHSMPFGAEITSDGIRFALWAPTAREVSLVLDDGEHSLSKDSDGWYRHVSGSARAGSRYGYRIDGDIVVPDPASRFQPDDVHGLSLVVDPQSYDWSDASWAGRPWEETVLYEVHVGTATPEGTYAGLMGKLEALRDLGVTAIELMPIGEFPGHRNWGYDGVLPYAPDAAYGSPEDLKRLVERAHELGLMVFLDVVYNHFGPSGNYLHAYAKTFFTERHPTPWGAGINVDGEGAGVVRDFFFHNALYWLQEFHFDGLRFDAVHAITDDGRPHFIEELANRIRQAIPDRHVHLVLENEANQARWLDRGETRQPKLHTAQWADDIHNSWHALLTGENEGYYEDYANKPLQHLGRSLAEGFAYQGDPSPHKEGVLRGEPSGHLPPSAFVAFLQNHDQIGNRAFGERLAHLIPPERLELAQAIFLLSPQIPLLFMGEEWAASTPFQFFVDFESEPDLAEAVRDGRRGEFKRFKAFTDPEMSQRIPDPTDRTTFERSRIDWTEVERSPHREVLSRTRHLLDIRRSEIVPLLKSDYRGSQYKVSSENTLDVSWRFAGSTLRLLANFGGALMTIPVEGNARALWASPGIDVSSADLQLTPWSGIILKGQSA
ncbi:malto-oligosyltrehalose trehalohydrolase [Microvirga lotononidis]|uniref:Malto-oligosyltrehalose trehalohydrolase n=1 Tax=Microvirga lotononidis TaxID=864069 RepID=I4YW02_9HYPH|nr:malto-oligosyltrehalose trehalohydrolase [Microvirga lotononidis]EIM28144.1 malto-oligosyltrehalose trehalohydrolase [Microvirga lotononidis]WQO27751.1 malto-oligosyltrehalose trehalohydrolase [Microvirga lotononidis]